MTDHPGLDEAWLRHEKHFPIGGDRTLQILKGQLLVEELMREILNMQLIAPDALKGSHGASFDCHHVICLVEALTPHSDKEPWVWPAAKRLNNIRNLLAHNLEPGAVSSKIDSLVKLIAQENASTKATIDKVGVPTGREVEAVVLAICACLASIKDYLLHLRQQKTA